MKKRWRTLIRHRCKTHNFEDFNLMDFLTGSHKQMPKKYLKMVLREHRKWFSDVCGYKF